MGWCTTSDLDQFTAAADGYLRSRAAENTLLLSAAQAAYAGRPGRPAAGGLLFGWWEPPGGGAPRGVFLHDPSVPLLLSSQVPEIAAALAAALAKMSRQVCGVDAPTEAADAFAAAWTQRAGTVARVHRHCSVYRLTCADLARPGAPATPGPALRPAAGPGQGPAGRLRVAAPGDLPLVTRWLAAYAAETAERIGSPTELAADLISYGGAVLWEVPPRPGHRWDGHHQMLPPRREALPPGEAAAQPAALAALTRPVAGSVRISMVYTPGERRRSGYAAALTRAVSRAVLAGDSPGASGLLGGRAARGPVAEVVLVTDRNRPDRWGTRQGYQLVSERTVLRFGPVSGPLPRLPSAGRAPRLPTGPLPRLPRLPR